MGANYNLKTGDFFVNQIIQTNGEDVIKYSREELTKKLCELLNELN